MSKRDTCEAIGCRKAVQFTCRMGPRILRLCENCRWALENVNLENPRLEDDGDGDGDGAAAVQPVSEVGADTDGDGEDRM